MHLECVQDTYLHEAQKQWKLVLPPLNKAMCNLLTFFWHRLMQTGLKKKTSFKKDGILREESQLSKGYLLIHFVLYEFKYTNVPGALPKYGSGQLAGGSTIPSPSNDP
jgi:hypothetical protein